MWLVLRSEERSLVPCDDEERAGLGADVARLRVHNAPVDEHLTPVDVVDVGLCSTRGATRTDAIARERFSSRPVDGATTRTFTR